MAPEQNRRLTAARRALGLTQDGLADLANTQVERDTGKAGAMDADYISKLERGVHTPTLGMLLRLAEALDCRVYDLVKIFDRGPRISPKSRQDD